MVDEGGGRGGNKESEHINDSKLNRNDEYRWHSVSNRQSERDRNRRMRIREPLSLQTLYDLLEIAPSLKEQKMVQHKMSWLHSNAYSSSHSVSFAEEFFYELSDIGHLELRLQLLIFERRFESVIGERYHEVAVLVEALRAMEASRAMEGILAVVLSFGNFMNVEVDHDGQLKGGGDAVGVSGFELDSLLRLKELKSNDGRLSMLSFLVEFCRSDLQWRHCLAP